MSSDTSINAQERLRKARESFISAVHLRERLFIATANPLHVWETWTLCRAARVAAPEWVNRYLDQAANNLASLVRNHRGRGDARKISAAMGFLGKSANISAFKTTKKEVPDVYHRYIEARLKGFKKETAFDEVAHDLGRHKRTVKDRFRLYCIAENIDSKDVEVWCRAEATIRSLTK